MLVPLTRKKFEELVPLVATADQYKYYWGKPSDLLGRFLISIVGVLASIVIWLFLPKGFEILEFIPAFVVGFYWLWGPIYQASRRNRELRRYQYSGFLRGEVLDVFVTEELIGQEETVNKKGELVIVENRERCLNLEVGDESGFMTKVQVPLKRSYRSIREGDIAEMIVLSNRPDLSRILQISDVYLSDYDLWVSDYPYLRKDIFQEVSHRLNQRGGRRYR